MFKLLASVLLLLMGFAPLHSADEPGSQAMSQPAGRVVEITAKRFNFSPAQITLKKGQPVTLRIKAEDVTHGFYLKPLKLDETIEPGKTKDVTVTPQVAGTFTTICDHFCGSGHGNMHMTIVVE
jgi:cytochrome c oxidase subunit 2